MTPPLWPRRTRPSMPRSSRRCTAARAPRAVVVPAPAGAGKSHLTVTAVDEARRKGLRVAVAAPTNEQAFGLVRAHRGSSLRRPPGPGG
jgi:chromosomal replication initiation ATPase DnaA